MDNSNPFRTGGAEAMCWTLLFNYQTLYVPGLSNPESAVKYKHIPFLYCNIYVEQETTFEISDHFARSYRQQMPTTKKNNSTGIYLWRRGALLSNYHDVKYRNERKKK